MDRLLRSVRVIGAVLAVAVVLYALGYLRPGMPSGFPEQLDVYRSRRFWLLLHIGGAAVALLLVPWQLWSGPRGESGRNSVRRAHRITGRVAATAIVVGAVGGLAMAWTAYGGRSNTVGFGTLAVLWVVTVVRAVRTVRGGDLQAHRRWALRTAALTFAAITLRLWLPILSPVIGFEAAYSVIGWLCWVPNLLVVEWWVRRTAAATELPVLR